MESFEKVAVGILLFVITSVTAYLFRMRQLYATAPKLYRHAPISKEGSMCELIVFNRGNQPEESVRVEFAPELRCELLASSMAGVSLTGSVIEIERLHKGTEMSALLLVENGILDTSRVTSISSKNVQGRVFKDQQSVPPNYAFLFLSVVAGISIFFAMLFSPDIFGGARRAYAEYKLAKHYEAGWEHLESYLTSDLRGSYSDGEFPLALRKLSRSGDTLVAEFDVFNKTALPLKISADVPNKKRADDAAPDITYFSFVEVPPMSKSVLDVKTPAGSGAAPRTEFYIRNGAEGLMGTRFRFETPTEAVGTVEQRKKSETP